MLISNIYEFILWDNCCNNCAFCWQKHNGYISSNKEKIHSLDVVLDFIKSKKFPNNSHILVVGGEIFDNGSNDIKNELQYFWKNIIDLQTTKKIGLVYINTNLLYYDLCHLDFLLTYALEKNMLNRIKFTTSYDSYGRFNTNEKFEIFSNNLQHIMNKYQNLNCVVNTILTKHFCETYNYNTSFIKEIQQKYTNRTSVNFLPYIAFDDKLIPTRSDIYKILFNENTYNPGFLSLYTSSMALNQLKYVFKIKGNKLEDYSCKLLECGHPENFKRYSTANSCFVCDLLRIANV